MCGLTGFWQPGNLPKGAACSIAQKMADSIMRRGPDDSGVWMDEGAGVVLAHRRLSILELSKAGHQPMISASGRFAIVFNGEIYNHIETRRELADLGLAVNWRGHSDTETLLAGFEAWGIEKTLKRTVGMFAIALWDRKEKTLTFARDRIGEKPLYYGFQKGTLIFGSELKAIKAHPNFNGEIDRGAICLYLRHCSIPAPYSIYKDIYKLMPGSYIQFPVSHSLSELRSIEPKVYWSLSDTVSSAAARPFTGNDEDAIAALELHLKKAIDLQMIADVPLGAFLSGGTDSSAVVALMQTQSSRPVKTFSVGFNEANYDEAKYAKAVARHIGTDHVEHYVSSEEAMSVIPKLGGMYDEPFADSSQIPTFLISKIAREQVKVSLSGDAGDELFCGYNRYRLADIWRNVSKIPFAIRRSTGRLINMVAPSTWDMVFRYAGKFIALPNNMNEKLEKLSRRLESVEGIESLYYSLVSEIADPSQVVINTMEPDTWLTEKGLSLQFTDPKLQMMYMDSMTYLPDDILVKVDRAAMFNSLETRIPFLDHRIIEFVWSLPMSMRIRNDRTKWILRQVLYKYVPKELIERPKMGFGIPIGEWLRGPLRGWADALLDESRLNGEGFFNAQFICVRWQEHLSGRRNWQYFLWAVLMFQEWLEE